MLDRTLVLIRERSYPELLDLAIVVVRNRPLTLGAAALAGIAPFAAFNAWLAWWSPESGFLALLAIPFEAPLATAPLTVALGLMMFGDRPTPAKVAGRVLGRWLPLLFYQVIIRGFLLGTLFFSPLIPARLGFVNEVILLERGKFRRVVPRSSQLSQGRGGDMISLFLDFLPVGLVFVVCFWVGTGAIWNALIETNLTWDRPEWSDLLSPRLLVPVWMWVAFSAVSRFLIYIDARIRLEGWEIELQLRALAAAMEEGR